MCWLPRHGVPSKGARTRWLTAGRVGHATDALWGVEVAYWTRFTRIAWLVVTFAARQASIRRQLTTRASDQ